MGLFSSKKKIEPDDGTIIAHIQYELNNNSNIEIERQVFEDVKFPNDNILETIKLVMLTTKGIFIFLPLLRIGNYIGGAFESNWIIGDNKFSNPINTQKQKRTALSSYLKIKSNNIIPYIILNNNSTIRDIPYCTKEYRIVWEKDLYYFLGLHTSILPDVFTKEELITFKKKIDKSNIIKELYNM